MKDWECGLGLQGLLREVCTEKCGGTKHADMKDGECGLGLHNTWKKRNNWNEHQKSTISTSSKMIDF